MQINGIEEKTLVERMISGDQTAFEILFRFYYPGLVIFVSQFLLNIEDSEEIVQDFFVILWEKRKNISTNYSFKSYLFTSVKNLSLNFLKREKMKENTIEDLKHIAKNDLLYEADLYIHSELQDEIKSAVGKLPMRTREIFDMSRFIGLRNDEIAQKLDISKRTVETQISNALKILRFELRDYITIFLLLFLF